MGSKHREAPNQSHPSDAPEPVEPAPRGRTTAPPEKTRLDEEEEDELGAVGPLTDV